MRKTISVTALTLALTCVAYAGDMPNGSPAPPPPTNGVQAEQTVNDNMLNEEPDGLTEAVLRLVESVLALF